MNCEILETFYLKSNGDILCNDDYGERVLLGCIAPADSRSGAFSASELFTNSNYSHIAACMAKEEIPWPGICEKCAFFRPSQQFSNELLKKRIKKFQVETSLACNLACPCCSNAIQIRTRKKPLIMPIEIFQLALDSFSREGYALDSIEYCGQGEPLLNPNFPKFVSTARQIYPNTVQRLITNGNFEYEKGTGGQFIDEIFVSCDGIKQLSYEKYRIRGQVEIALKFLNDVPRYQQGRRQRLTWKYILFEFNDSDEELIEAQRLAQEFGVDTMLFVLTHSLYRSQRFTLETIGELPIRYQNVRTNAHPSFYEGVKTATFSRRRKIEELGELLPLAYRFCLDEVTVFKDNVLWLRGWAAGKTQITNVKVYLNRDYVGAVVPQEFRDDVERTYPLYPEQSPGFRMSAKLDTPIPDQAVIRLDLYSGKRIVRSVQRNFSLEKS